MMRARTLISDLILVLLYALGGGLVGLSVSLFNASVKVSALDLRTDGLLRLRDVGTVETASSLLTGTVGLLLPILTLVLSLVVISLGLLLYLRNQEDKLRAVLNILIGILAAGVLVSPVFLFISAPSRAEAALTAAGMGSGPIIRSSIVPRILSFLLLGAAIGWNIGAVRCDTWGRRIGLTLLGFVFSIAASVVLIYARPPVVEMPADMPALATGNEGVERTVWLIGGTDQAVPVRFSIKAYLSQNSTSGSYKVDRRNVAKAIKLAQSLPMVHPQSEAAERLLAAGAIAEFDTFKAAQSLLKNYRRRGHQNNALLATSMIGNLAPSSQAIMLLKQATNPAEIRVGAAAAKRLCGLVLSSGNAELAKRISCAGAATKRNTGKITATIYLKGRPLRRTPVGLIAEARGLDAPWVKGGSASVDTLKLVAGSTTGTRGELNFEHVLPGTYLLAFAPRRPQKETGPIKLTRAVSIVVPEKGGELNLGDIEAAGAKRVSKRGPLLSQRTEDLFSNINPTLDNEEGKQDELPRESSDAEEQPASRGTLKRTAPLPRSVQKAIAQIRQAGPNRVIVPADFGHMVLKADSSIISRTASVVEARSKTGQPIGLEVRGIRPNGVLTALGFEEGDVVQSVNGRPIRGDEDLVALVEALEGTQRVRVRIKRQGRLKLLNIEVER